MSENRFDDEAKTEKRLFVDGSLVSVRTINANQLFVFFEFVCDKLRILPKIIWAAVGADHLFLVIKETERPNCSARIKKKHDCRDEFHIFNLLELELYVV